MIPTSLFFAVLTMNQSEQTQEKKIDSMVSDFMRVRHVPGVAISVVKDGKPILTKGYGLASIDYDVPVKPETTFLLASITKSFTATAIMMLVEQDKLKLDDPISKYLDETPETWKDITVRNLLSHTAGLKDRFEEYPMESSKWKVNYSTSSMYKTAKETPLDYKPGERSQYSDQGYFLLGMIIEKVSDESYGEFLKKHIFEPCGMSDSTTIRLSAINKGLATGYTVTNGKVQHNFRRMEFGMVSHFGVISNVGDLAKFDAALYGERLLKQSSLKLMWTPSKTVAGAEVYMASLGSYGLGWFLNTFNGHRSVGHAGATGTMFLRYPEDKLTVIVLTNLEQLAGGDAPSLAKAIAQQYIPDLRWSKLKVHPDPKPQNSKTIKDAMEGLASGKVDSVLFDPGFYAILKPQLAMQRAGLQPLGELKTVEFLEARSLGVGELLYYKLTYKDITLYASAQMNGAGQIQYLAVEQDLSEE